MVVVVVVVVVVVEVVEVVVQVWTSQHYPRRDVSPKYIVNDLEA